MALNGIIPNLIETGPDALSNLFKVTITPKGFTMGEGFFVFRTESVEIPTLKISTVQIPYQNTFFEKIIPSFEGSKKISFLLRLDESYKLYQALEQGSSIDFNGNWKPERTAGVFINNWDITVEALRMQNKPETFEKDTGYTKVSNTWYFKDCRLITIPNITLNYNDSNPVKVKVEFTFNQELNTIPISV